MLMRLQQISFSKIADWNVKWYNHPEKQFDIFIFFLVVFFYKTKHTYIYHTIQQLHFWAFITEK